MFLFCLLAAAGKSLMIVKVWQIGMLTLQTDTTLRGCIENFKCMNRVVKEFQFLVTSPILIVEVVLTKYLLFQEETSSQIESKVGVPHSINMVLLLFLPVSTHFTTHETLSEKHP
jgi:hypothetical protein